MNVVLSDKCTGTIGDSKPAPTSPYDGTKPVILLRPEDMHERLNHQLTMHISHIYLEIHSYKNDLQNESKFVSKFNF